MFTFGSFGYNVHLLQLHFSHLRMIHMNCIVIGEWNPILLILFVGSEVSSYTRQENKDGRYRYSGGGDLLRFKVV